jgi:acetyl esterase
MRRLALAALLLASCRSTSGRDSMSWLQTSPADAPGGLDPKLKAALEAAGPAPDFDAMDLPAIRKWFADRVAATPPVKDKVAKVEDRKAGNVPVRIYTPEGKGPFPVLLYLHGGGWVLGGLDSHDDVCRSFCRRAGVLVVSADYRLAPEARHPAAIQDAYAALRWTAERAAELGGRPDRLAVGGDSAGGNLAAALALRARDRGGPKIAYQLLIYPVTVRDFETPSYRQYASGFGLTRKNMIWFWDRYLADAADADDPYAAPLRAADLAGLPPALLVTAECDVLRDEGEAYGARLAEAGVAVRGVRYMGLNHGFVRMGAAFPQALKAVDDMAAALREALR